MSWVFEVFLPYPPKELNPNRTTTKAVWQEAKRQYKRTCYSMAVAAIKRGPALPVHRGCFHVEIFVARPDKGRRDLDNVFCSMKSGLDGVAEALFIDDRRFASYLVAGREGGCGVTVRIVPAEDGQ